MNVRLHVMLFGVALVTIAAASQSAASTKPRIMLDEWYRASQNDGTVTLAQRGPDVVVRISLRPAFRGALPMTVRVYGGQTPGITWPKTDCDVVYNNAMTSLVDAERPDNGVSIRRNLGTIRGVSEQKIIRGITIRTLRRTADSIAVWRWGSAFLCGDL